MNHYEVVLVVLFLAVFVVVPVVNGLIARRRKPAIVPNLKECPDCGAQNPGPRQHCYCCGFGFILPQSNRTEATLIQRGKAVG